jgi:hypothetical protein
VPLLVYSLFKLDWWLLLVLLRGRLAQISKICPRDQCNLTIDLLLAVQDYGSNSTAQIVDCILDLELWYSHQCCGEPESPASWRRQHRALLNPSPFDKKAQLADIVNEDESHFSIGNPDPG